MTLNATLGRRSVRTAYIVGAGALVVVMMTAGQAERIPSWLAVVAVLVYLGPLGLAALLAVMLPMVLIVLLPAPILTGVCVAVALGVAAINVAIVRRWSERASTAGAEAGRSRYRVWDPLVRGSLFVLAGCAFIVLCVMAGFAALTAHGVDVQTPDDQAARTLLAAGLTWWTGLAIAVTGLVIWIRRARRGRLLLPWAAGDLGAMVALIVALQVSLA